VNHEQFAAIEDRDDWFITAHGRTCFVRSPELSEISIDDIAVALSRIHRFGGHTRPDVPFYSVAQHSVIVSQCVPTAEAPAALLHDAAEAYLGDVIRPVKGLIAAVFKPLEQAWEREIGRLFGLGDQLAEPWRSVKHADNVTLMTEKRDLVAHGPRRWASPRASPILPLMPDDACALFLERFTELFELQTGGHWRPCVSYDARSYVP
jgi:5'-deoxynucleotidase YfbR-like HD superfamily hydrolase